MSNSDTKGKHIKLLESLRTYNTYSWVAFIPLGALLHFVLDFSYVAGALVPLGVSTTF
jgi:ABC-type dipeptide/oligopeptide/nickel transport system permease subunit